jgi:arabinogalactan oligomer / maltooligosaccharide transport system substrate-binding protein
MNFFKYIIHVRIEGIITISSIMQYIQTKRRIIMKRNIFKKSTAVALASILSCSLFLTACKERPEGTVVENEKAGEKANESVQDSGIIEEEGLKWDVAAAAYIMEDDILSGKETLKLWLDNDDFGASVVAGFEAKYPGTKVEFQNVGAVDSGNKLTLDGEAGVGADVYLMPHDHIGSAYNRSIIAPMGRYEAEIIKRFTPTSIGTVDIDSQIWGIPYLTESIGLFYNKTLLQKLVDEGMIDSAEPAKDFNDIIELAGKYNDEANGKYTLRFHAEDSYINYMWLTAFGFELFGPNADDPNNPGFDQQATIDGLNYFKSIRQIWDVKAGDISADFVTEEFAKGETPYLIMGPWASETVMKGAEEFGFDFSITTIPLMDGRQPYTFSGNQIIAVSPYSKYPAAARVLAMYVASNETLTYAYSKMGKIPALNPEYVPEIAGLVEDDKVQGVMAQAVFSKPMPSIKEIGFYWDPAKTLFMSTWDSISTPEEAAKKAYDDYMLLLKTAQ